MSFPFGRTNISEDRKEGSDMYSLGNHILAELRNCNSEVLKDVEKVREIMVAAAKKAKATIVAVSFHEFSPFGISGVIVIAESHLTIHTWPEYAYAAIDIFTCGDQLQPDMATQHLIKEFGCENPSVLEMKRGILESGNKKFPHKPEEKLKVPT
jgi:S-adenosylmethionine decarboxylase